MSVKVKELRGYRSVLAYNAFYALLMGLAVEQAHLGQRIETTFAKFEALPEEQKEEQLKHALKLVNLSKDDMLNLLAFAVDANGIPYAQKDVEEMEPQKIFEGLLVVCMAFAKIKPFFLNENVKKNCPPEA